MNWWMKSSASLRSRVYPEIVVHNVHPVELRRVAASSSHLKRLWNNKGEYAPHRGLTQQPANQT
jgi:hypothetical protein